MNETMTLTRAKVPRMADEDGQETARSSAVMDQSHGKRAELSDIVVVIEATMKWNNKVRKEEVVISCTQVIGIEQWTLVTAIEGTVLNCDNHGIGTEIV